MQLGGDIEIAPEDNRCHAAGVLGTTFHPSELLRPYPVHFHRQLGWGFDILQVDNLPIFQLRPIAEVKVLRESVRLRATGVVDGLLSPDTGSTVKLQKMLSRFSAHLLNGEMDIQLQGLQLSEQRIVLVEVGPACLHHTDLVILEIRNGVLQEFFIKI